MVFDQNIWQHYFILFLPIKKIFGISMFYNTDNEIFFIAYYNYNAKNYNNDVT